MNISNKVICNKAYMILQVSAINQAGNGRNEGCKKVKYFLNNIIVHMQYITVCLSLANIVQIQLNFTVINLLNFIEYLICSQLTFNTSI